jgi:hypothetical protein
MTLPGKVIEASNGLLGFDCNTPLGMANVKLFRSKGRRFAIRYVGRVKNHSNDLTRSEASNILAFGLGLMLVQHVHPDSETTGWWPTGKLGEDYGSFAAASAIEVGVRYGTTVWLDLEGVAARAKAEDVIAYCNEWHSKVGHAGYTPGIYVGFSPILTATQLYRNLKFEHYWAAYNLNKDQHPIIRDVQMVQGLEKSLGGIQYDPDEIKADKLGGLPLMMVDNEWTE